MPNDNSPDTTSRRRGIMRGTGLGLLVAGGLAGLVLGITSMANADEATSGSDSAAEEQHSDDSNRGASDGERHDRPGRHDPTADERGAAPGPRAHGDGERAPRSGDDCDPPATSERPDGERAEPTAGMR